MRIQMLLLSVISPFLLCTQSEITEKQILVDYAIFKNILISSHPSLYEYTTAQQWDSLFGHFENELKTVKKSSDLFKLVSELSVHVKDGHLRVLHPTMDTIPAMFPLLLKIIGGKLYTNTEDFGIPLGSEIISINHLNSQVIVQKLLKYATSDGNNLTKKYRQIESEFGILLYYEFGTQKDYTITYKTPENQTTTSQIKSQAFQSIGSRNAKRSSYFSNYQHKDIKDQVSNNLFNQKLPFVYFIDSIKTAILTVNSFGINPQEFKSMLIDIFKEIKHKKSTSLVIDVRQNSGGYRANAITLLSFISDKAFKQRISESAITSTLVEPEYVMNTMSDYDIFFKNYFTNSTKKDGRWILNNDRAEELMIPRKHAFKSNIFVLIGGNTFSAGAAFALSAKNNSQIMLFGEETGGGYYFHTGQFPVLYQLPNSKILINISLIKIDHFVKDHSVPKGSGILPDVEINFTQKDLINGIDGPLLCVLKHINNI